jgi:GT2 family glycosyltransferase
MSSPSRAQRRHPERHEPSSVLGAKSGGVVIAYPHPVGEVGARFHQSLVDLLVRDAYTNHHVVGHMPISSGANITTARNKIVREFLSGYPSNPEWLWFVDADMVFADDTLDRLLASADKDKRPIMGGLCFALLKGNAQEIVPTLYGFSQAQTMVRYNGFPENQIIQVVGTGGACLLIHRGVLEAIGSARWTDERVAALKEQTGQDASPLLGQPVFDAAAPWFREEITGPNWGDIRSEDLTFCIRAGQMGFPVFVDTSIEIGHVKPVVIDKAAFYKALPGEEEPAPTYVVIPVKGKWDEFTLPLMKQIVEQGGYDKVFIFDNASGTDDAVPEEAAHSGLCVEVIPAAGKTIHEMWNMGIRQSLATSQRCNIVVLNNDLILGDDFLNQLTKGLRSHPSLASVSANYDNRKMVELVQAVKGIAAGREDGTGGWAGFAFAVRGEIFTAGCPMFDEQFELWYGDNDFLLNLEKAEATYGIVRDAHVTHIGGGSNTSGDGKGKRLTPELEAVVEQDRVKFEKKHA